MLSLISKLNEEMTASELEKLIEKRGWEFEREGKGSHKIYKHPNFPHIISIPFHSKKDLGKGLLNTLMKRAGLK